MSKIQTRSAIINVLICRPWFVESFRSERPEGQPIHCLGDMIRSQVGVDRGRLDVRMAHELLDGRQVNAFHHQVAGKRVAQSVGQRRTWDTYRTLLVSA
jgi:hypothetical protein